MRDPRFETGTTGFCAKFAVTLLLALLGPACSSPVGPVIRVEAPWSSPTPGTGPGAAYLVLNNDGDAPDRLLRVRSTYCGAIELKHTRVQDDGTSVEPVDEGIAIAAGERVELEPGGYHLVLNKLPAPLRDGMRFEMVLEFERSGEIAVTVDVRER